MAAAKKGIDLAIVFGGKGKGGSQKPPAPDAPERDESEDDDEAEELPPGFESAATEALGDLDPDQLHALVRAIRACTDSY